MSYKSRGNWRLGACLKNCLNRGKLCDECFRFSKLKEVNEDGQEENTKQNG
jgi:hypothetical protein